MTQHRITVGEELRYDADVRGLRGLSGTYVPRNNLYDVVVDGGADPTGATGDLGAVITAAAIGLAAKGGGVITGPPGLYRFTTTGAIADRTVSMQFPGSEKVRFLPQSALGANPCVDISGGSGFSTFQAGKYGGFYISGAGNAVGTGMRYGDLVGGWLEDVVIDRFNGVGGVGLEFINRNHWTERTLMTRVTLGQSIGNTTNWKFTVAGGTESFGYTRALDVHLNLYSTPVTGTVPSVSLTSGSTSATVASGGFPGVTVGAAVQSSVTGVPAGSTVAAVSGNTLTLSAPAVSTTSASLYFGDAACLGIFVGQGASVYHCFFNFVCNAAGGTPGTTLTPLFLYNNAQNTAGGYGLVTSEMFIQGETDGKVVRFVGANSNSNTQFWGYVDWPGLSSGQFGSSSIFVCGGQLNSPGILTPSSDTTRAALRGFGNVVSDYVLSSYINGTGNFNSFTISNAGDHGWGSGASAVDLRLRRTSANVATIDNGSGGAATLRLVGAATGSRPSASTVGQGAQFFDTTLNKPIWSTGSAWVDAAGSAV